MASFPSDTAAQISTVQTEIAMSPGLPNVYFFIVCCEATSYRSRRPNSPRESLARETNQHTAKTQTVGGLGIGTRLVSNEGVAAGC